MKIFGYELKKQIKAAESKSEPVEEMSPDSSTYQGRGRWLPVSTQYFDGEKTPGELGYLVNLLPNHSALRHRAFEANLKSDIVKIITGKFFKWVIGSGLKLQSEPSLEVLKSEGITALKDAAKFRKSVEARFDIYANSNFSDYKQMQSFHQSALDAFKTAFLGGDCLCILRVGERNNVNIQVIDGEHVKSPVFDTALMEAVKARGNTVLHGVELNSKGEHVAYFINVADKDNIFGKFERIIAKGEKTGRTMAWLVYGDKHRIDHVRGIPIITQILEKVEKLDRYTEAVVGSAEERAKIVFSIEHTKESDGSNPLLDKVRQSSGMGSNAASETSGYELGEKTAATIAATTSKQTFNMPIGAKLNSALGSSSETEYGPFSKAVFVFICASVDIPPEVALQLYEQNYSSSRAAINGWDYIVKIYRRKFAEKFYQNFYNLWLEMEVVLNKVDAPGFIKAMQEDNYMVTQAYFNARFTGSNMPHIDPLKEVNAVRQMLGKTNTDALISRESAAEILGLGDWEKNNEKYIEETALVPEKPIINEPSNNENGQQKPKLDGKKQD